MVSRETETFKRKKVRKSWSATTAADRVRIEKRKQQALEFRMAGATLQDIVNAGIGYKSTQHVGQDLQQVMKGIYQEDIENLILLDLARIDEMQKICTLVMRMERDTSQVRNIMALMQFRRETMGITPEQIQDRRASTTSVTNNGIMVVQGSTQEYLEGLMKAVGASENEIENEFQEVQKSLPGSPEVFSGNNTGARVIQGELVEKEVSTETGTSKSKLNKKTGKKFKLVRKPALETGAPGSNTPSQATTATHSRSQARSVSQVALGDSILLGELVEARARQLEHEIEHMHEPGLGDLSDPAVIPEELALQGVLEVPIKLPDSNVPVSPGVVYRNPPRKLTQDEGRKVVLRKVKNSHTDVMKTHVHEEEI